ncbi:Cytochrome P450 81Q32 [Linum perenne]
MAAFSLLFYCPLFLAMYIIFHHFKNKLHNLPPSPFPSLPIIGHLHLLRRPLHRSLSQISAQHGPLVLLQFGLRRVLLISSPALAQDCFTKNDVVFANRPWMAVGRRLAYNCTTLAWAPYGDHWQESSNRGLFLSLLEFYASDIEHVKSVVLENAPKNQQMTSPDIQKDIVHALALETTKLITADIGDDFFAILADESRDVSVKEQMGVVLRYVDGKGCVIERFLGISHVRDTKAISLKTAIESMLMKNGLSISRVRGQGYDGASNMKGEINGLKTLILEESPSAYYIHCFAHRLQLTLVAVAQNHDDVNVFFFIVGTVTNLVGASCKRQDIIRQTQANKIEEAIALGELETGRGLNQEIGMKRPSDTRWGSHFATLVNLENLFSTLVHTLQNLEGDRKATAQASVVLIQLEDFEFAFMMKLMIERYYGDNVSDAEEARRFRGIQEETMRLAGETNLEDFLPWVRSKDLERRMGECHRKRDSFFQELIEEWRKKEQSHLNSSTERKCLIQVLLSLQHKEPEYCTDDIIKGMIMVLLSAGTETSSNTVEWALSLLLKHPHTLKAAQLEIDTLVGTERLVEETDLGKLHYLQGIINETMRKYPALPLLVPHESSEECVVGGYKVPSGTILLVNSWAIHNDAKIWDDPDEFKPERFEEGGGRGDDEGDDDGLKFMAFGYGRRSCPGEGLGMRMVSLTLAALIQCFEWEIDHEVDMSEETGFTMAKALPLKVKSRPRYAMLKLLSQV